MHSVYYTVHPPSWQLFIFSSLNRLPTSWCCCCCCCCCLFSFPADNYYLLLPDKVAVLVYFHPLTLPYKFTVQYNMLHVNVMIDLLNYLSCRTLPVNNLTRSSRTTLRLCLPEHPPNRSWSSSRAVSAWEPLWLWLVMVSMTLLP